MLQFLGNSLIGDGFGHHADDEESHINNRLKDCEPKINNYDSFDMKIDNSYGLQQKIVGEVQMLHRKAEDIESKPEEVFLFKMLDIYLLDFALVYRMPWYGKTPRLQVGDKVRVNEEKAYYTGKILADRTHNAFKLFVSFFYEDAPILYTNKPLGKKSFCKKFKIIGMRNYPGNLPFVYVVTNRNPAGCFLVYKDGLEKIE
jgi:hypothetical protein